jgi:hypothetical protein
MMTRREVWRKVGDAFATPRQKRNLYYLDATHDGMCHAIIGLTHWHLPIAGTLKEIANLDERSPDAYWLPVSYMDSFSLEDDNIRSLFAYLIAELTDKEYVAIGGSLNLYKGLEKLP